MALNIDEHRSVCRGDDCEFKRIPLSLEDYHKDSLKRPGGSVHETKLRILYPKEASMIVSYCQPEEVTP